MAFFVVSYDLVKENDSHDYQPLWDEFERLDSVKCLLSVYLLAAGNTPQEIANHFEKFIDDNDRLIVAEFTVRPKFTKALKGTTAWLNKHFS